MTLDDTSHVYGRDYDPALLCNSATVNGLSCELHKNLIDISFARYRLEPGYEYVVHASDMEHLFASWIRARSGYPINVELCTQTIDLTTGAMVEEDGYVYVAVILPQYEATTYVYSIRRINKAASDG